MATATLCLTRPVVYDVQFERKSGRTPQGWPVEQIKAGGLLGLVAYACFYASREQRPHLVVDASLGLDEQYCDVFWSQLAAFSTVPDVVAAARAYLAACRDNGSTSGPLMIADGFSVALDPRRRYLLWWRPTAQIELITAAGALVQELRAIFAAHPNGPYTDESDALEMLSTRLIEARSAVDAVAAACAYSIVDSNRVLSAMFGDDVRRRNGGSLIPPSTVIYDAPLELRDGLWSAPTALLASAWTHIEARLFSAIPPWELLGAGWDRPRYEHAADAARGLVEHFNAGTLWVSAEVLMPHTADLRAGAIARWLQLAASLHRLHNYSAVFQIAIGLRRDCVARLTESWARVPPAALDRWALLQALTDDKHGYRSYREELRSLPAGCALVPHLGAHTLEISIRDALLPAKVEAPGGLSKHIHFRRHRELFDLQHGVFALQEREYTPDELGPEMPQLVNGLQATFRPYYFNFEEDRESAVARLGMRSLQLEPAQ